MLTIIMAIMDYCDHGVYSWEEAGVIGLGIGELVFEIALVVLLIVMA